MVVTFAEADAPGVQSPGNVGATPTTTAAPSPLSLDNDSPMFALEDGEEPADGWCVAARQATRKAGARPVGGNSPGAVLSRPDTHSRTWLLCVHLTWLTRLIQSSGQGLAVTSGPLFSEVSQYLGPSKRRGAPNGQQVRVLPARVCVRGRQERRRRSPRASDSEPGSLLSVVPCLRPVADPLART